jgi:hypothetical protein
MRSAVKIGTHRAQIKMNLVMTVSITLLSFFHMGNEHGHQLNESGAVIIYRMRSLHDTIPTNSCTNTQIYIPSLLTFQRRGRGVERSCPK